MKEGKPILPGSKTKDRGLERDAKMYGLYIQGLKIGAIAERFGVGYQTAQVAIKRYREEYGSKKIPA